MDRRYDQRISAELPVLLTLLDSSSLAQGRLLDISESGVSVSIPCPAEPGALVKLQVLGLLFYGHVAYCNPEYTTFRVGIFVEPALLDSTNLIHLVDSFLIDHVG